MVTARIRRKTWTSWQGYRSAHREDKQSCDSRTELQSAAHAIHLAILAVAHHAGDDRPEVVEQRIHRVQQLLLEATQALSRAKIYVPGIWSYSPAVVLDQDPSPKREIARLNGLTMALATRNHRVLPSLPQALPLSEEEEAQLAVVSDSVSLAGRHRQLSRYGWWATAALAFALAPLLGVLGVAMALACAGVAFWKMGKKEANMTALPYA